MEEHASPTAGFTRRDLLRRGAIVGGGLVWAAPVVQTVGRTALAQGVGTPPPGEGALSYVAMVLTCNGERHQVKFDIDSWSWDDPGAVPGCAPPTGWCEPGRGGPPGTPPGRQRQEAGTEGGGEQAAMATDDPCPQRSDGGVLGLSASGDAAQVCFLLPATCLFESGVAMGAGGEQSPDVAGGFCAGPDVQPVSGQTVCFTSLK